VQSILGDGDCFYNSVRAAVASKLAADVPLVKKMREWVADIINSDHLSFYQMQAVAHPNEQWLQFVRQPTSAVEASKPRKKRSKKDDATDDSTSVNTEQQPATATAVSAAAAAKSTRSSSKLAEQLSSAAADSTAVVKVDKRTRAYKSSIKAAAAAAATTVTAADTGAGEQVAAAAAVQTTDAVLVKDDGDVIEVKPTVDTSVSSSMQQTHSKSEQNGEQNGVHDVDHVADGATTPLTAKMAAAAAAAAEAFAIANSSTVATTAASTTDAVDVTASSEKPVTPLTLSAAAPPSTSRKRKCTVNSDGSAKKYREDTTAIVDELGNVIQHATAAGDVDSTSSGPAVSTVDELKDYIKRCVHTIMYSGIDSSTGTARLGSL
jgi:hypothetical protein